MSYLKSILHMAGRTGNTVDGLQFFRMFSSRTALCDANHYRNQPNGQNVSRNSQDLPRSPTPMVSRNLLQQSISSPTRSSFRAYCSASSQVDVFETFRRVKGAEATQRNYDCRMELANAHRVLQYYQMNEGTCNHLSVIAPAKSGNGDTVMLLSRHGVSWNQTTGSSLLGLDYNGRVVEGKEWRPEGECGDTGDEAEVSACSIHLGMHKAMPDRLCIMHIHPTYTTSLSCSADPQLRMCHQNSMRFYKNIHYDRSYSGFATSQDEGTRLASSLGAGEILIMCHHGVLAALPTVSLALDSLYYLERAAMFQIVAESRNGVGLSVIPPDICATYYKDSFNWRQNYADQHYMAISRLLAKQGGVSVGS